MLGYLPPYQHLQLGSYEPVDHHLHRAPRDDVDELTRRLLVEEEDERPAVDDRGAAVDEEDG